MHGSVITLVAPTQSNCVGPEGPWRVQIRLSPKSFHLNFEFP